MKACPACGESNADDARFCAACGAPQSARCPRCSAELPDGARFCPSCGTPLEPAADRGHERKLVTVLFADLSGFTGLGERFDPEELREIMELYFTAARREIEAERGTVEKFAGDAVMAVFGVPNAHDDDPTRALRAALRIREAMRELNRSLSADHGVTLEVRIGVNMGEVVALANPPPGEPMVVGDPVNVAARLEQVAEPGQIVVSERAARASRGMRFRELGPLQLKGKGQTVQAVELLEAQSELWQPPGLRPPLVGRSRENALLSTLYQRVASEERPHLMTIYGDAGVGKSRLVEEFTTWAAGLRQAPRVVTGRCLPYLDGLTYWPLAEILKREAGVLESDTGEEAMASIRALAGEMLTPELGTEPVRATAALALTVGLSDPESPMDGLEPRRIRTEMAEAWTAFFSAMARRNPVVVVFEDAHWADPAMLGLLQELADRVQGRVLFLCSARPEMTGRRPDWGGGRWNFSGVLLEPLPAPESELLLDYLLGMEAGGRDVQPNVREKLLERAGGNPFFLEELVHHAIEMLDLVPGKEKPPMEIPDTVQGVIAARMDLLGPLFKRTLQSAAVVGRVFWTGPVARLSGADPEQLDDAMEGLRERGLILARLGSTIAGEREFIFKHVLTRDVAYESLPRRERAAAHASVGAWIEETAGEREKEFEELLAHHYAEAYRNMMADPKHTTEATEGMRSRAFRFALQASETARSQMALDKGERLARSAIGLATGDLERAHALEAVGRVCLLDFKGDEAWQALTEAIHLEIAAAPDATADILEMCAVALEVATRARGTMRAVLSRADVDPYLEIAKRYLGGGESEGSARVLAFQSYWPWMFREGPGDGDDIETARKAGERAADIALRIGHPEVASIALDGVSQYYLRQGLYSRMGSLLEQRLALVSEIQDPWELGDIFATAAWAEFCTGHYGRARDLAEQGAGLARNGAVAAALHCLDWLALARCRLGDWQGLFGEARLIEELLGERRDRPPGFASDHFGAVAFVHEVQGDSAEADRRLEVLLWLEQIEERPSPVWMAWAALVLARRGAFGEARDRLGRIDQIAPGHGRGPKLEASCDILCEEGAWDEVAGAVESARVHAEAAGLVALPLFADRAEGRAALAGGDIERATKLLSRAAAGFGNLEAEWDRAVAELWLAEALRAAGRRENALHSLRSARDVFARLGAVDESARSDAMLAALS